jgi:hypothetical protein
MLLAAIDDGNRMRRSADVAVRDPTADSPTALPSVALLAAVVTASIHGRRGRDQCVSGSGASRVAENIVASVDRARSTDPKGLRSFVGGS